VLNPSDNFRIEQLSTVKLISIQNVLKKHLKDHDEETLVQCNSALQSATGFRREFHSGRVTLNHMNYKITTENASYGHFTQFLTD